MRIRIAPHIDDLGLDGIGPGCRPPGRAKHPQPPIGTGGEVRWGLGPK